jgi:GT2 family glycosyltransferase
LSSVLPDPLAPPAAAEIAAGASITVGICTRNRHGSLARCVRSLARIAPRVAEVIVVDDGSDEPVEPALRATLGEDAPPRLSVIRRERSAGLCAGRNAVLRAARTPWVLNLDDDAVVVDPAAVEDAVRVLEEDPRVGAIAFAQADEHGEPWPQGAQPARSEVPCWAASFIGFAHLLRRDAALAVGGFDETMGINGEEKDLCLRLLGAGWGVVYLPAARVAHLADPAGRDLRVYLHHVVRNDVLGALRNEPFPLVLASAPVRLLRYFPMRRGWRVDDPGGFLTVLAGLLRLLPATLRRRRAVSWRTWRTWRERARTAPPYTPPQDVPGPGPG